jgi:L-aspartate oxidase
LARTESRGAHHRADHPRTDPAWSRHLDVRLADGEIVISSSAVTALAEIAG